ncbi:Nif3-like dinuclear metal center hexameric protein [Panacibacter ginsenosidivorans]|uniref:GTP cyclohydrolase 1 type 2 homolog n=1 Tax=Panacibacter ginsenosidivorans TaxID=1813871 RepID=A0A5B8VF46_9BACT|nr:Nif3-like dinuclear metal center hexameric protein [Panacibacter ginsenosidivorans]QEC68948.1 Nif3-like dinuclear metal center hexameric protein [Panacibacter ginsenosidivorans]
MKIAEVIQLLEQTAPPSYQESYDNAGLLTGNAGWDCTGIICSLDATEDVILEAKSKGCNLVVSHHPIIFGGLKKITGKNYVEKTVITAIKNDIAIYAIHTNLDNVINGVNDKMADKLGLINKEILAPKSNQLMKLFTFVPTEHAAKVRTAIFESGGGNIGNYSECSFNAEGTGTFKAGDGTDPFVGKVGIQHHEREVKIETIFPAYLQHKIVSAMIKAHPYEEVAYDVVALANEFQQVGSGLVGELPEWVEESTFLAQIKTAFGLSVIRHTPLLAKKIKKVALCGGAGSFLTARAIASGADIYITADVKYHEFFDADGRLVIADIGHWESEQFTIDLLFDILKAKFPTFAVLKTEVKTNPVNYYK